MNSSTAKLAGQNAQCMRTFQTSQSPLPALHTATTPDQRSTGEYNDIINSLRIEQEAAKAQAEETAEATSRAVSG